MKCCIFLLNQIVEIEKKGLIRTHLLLFRNLITLGRYRSCCDAKTNDGRYEVENWCDELAKRVRKRDQYRTTIVAVEEKGRCFAAFVQINIIS